MCDDIIIYSYNMLVSAGVDYMRDVRCDDDTACGAMHTAFSVACSVR